jgi:hypothetical protein
VPLLVIDGLRVGYIPFMDSNEPSVNRRPGPIGFHGESKVTNLQNLEGSNENGIGEASMPTLEGARGSKKLRAINPLILGLSGVLAILFGAIFSLIILIIGIWLLIFSIYLNQSNKTTKRLSEEAKRRTGP